MGRLPRGHFKNATYQSMKLSCDTQYGNLMNKLLQKIRK